MKVLVLLFHYFGSTSFVCEGKIMHLWITQHMDDYTREM